MVPSRLHPSRGWLLALLVCMGCASSDDVAQQRPPRMAQEKLTGCTWFEREVSAMGTVVEIKAWGADPEQLERAVTAACAEIARVEDLMTDWRPSELTRLNAAAGNGARSVPRELAAIIARAVEVGKLTDGAFDVTYAGAGQLWDFKAVPPVLPDPAQIEAALAHVDYSRVGVDPRASSVTLPAHTQLGLGGIAKGYGVDRAMAVLMEHGVEHAIVNAGGDLKVLGRKNGAPWEIAIKHPRDRQRAMAVLQVSNTCVVTSGDYERFFEQDGRRYHHIIDPRTGYPSQGCLSATVVAPSAELADALATACCVLGVERGLQVLEGLPRVDGILVGLDGQVHVTPGLEGVLQ